MKMNKEQNEINRLIQGCMLQIQDMVNDNIVLGSNFSKEYIQEHISNYVNENMSDEYKPMKVDIE